MKVGDIVYWPRITGERPRDTVGVWEVVGVVEGGGGWGVTKLNLKWLHGWHPRRGFGGKPKPDMKASPFSCELVEPLLALALMAL